MASKRSLIIELFVSEVRMFRIGPPHLENAALGQPLPQYLDAMIGALEQGRRQSNEVLRAATDHAKQRARIGYDLRALLTEFGILRSTIVEVASEMSDVSADEWERLGQLLHESMMEAAGYFVDAQKPAAASPAASTVTASNATMSMKPR